jgi:hypothetical protein
VKDNIKIRVKGVNNDFIATCVKKQKRARRFILPVFRSFSSYVLVKLQRRDIF